MKRPSPELYALIAAAERAAQAAHNASYREPNSYWLRTGLGRAQSILIHYVVKYAGTPPVADKTPPDPRLWTRWW